MTDLAHQPLLTPFRMGELLLPNRIVMAPPHATARRQFGACSDVTSGAILRATRLGRSHHQ
jgi:2,4-dienoyl-CoA reductase-like NADH-dependent reductase (Old Yellow Enzyme family)